MAIGDQADIVARLKSVLPSGWFPTSTPGQPSESPVLDGVLGGIANVMAWLYSLIQYAKLQTRIQTSTDGWLDITSTDFFGDQLPRHPGESDASFINRILANIPPQGATRNALFNVVKFLTGYDPVIKELWVPGDTGAYNKLGGYDVFGAYSAPLTYQGFIDIVRKYQGIPWLAGYDAPGGGYGSVGGMLKYASLDEAPGYVSDSTVYNAINKLHAFGTVIWARFLMTVDHTPGPVPPPPPPPQPAYVGGYGPVVNGLVTYALNGYSIPSASAYS